MVRSTHAAYFNIKSGVLGKEDYCTVHTQEKGLTQKHTAPWGRAQKVQARLPITAVISGILSIPVTVTLF